MKYLLLILFIVLVVFATKALRRLGQRDDAAPGARAGGKAAKPSDEVIMLACAHCGLHLPRNEALPGRHGVYCSEAHRATAEARDGDT